MYNYSCWPANTPSIFQSSIALKTTHHCQISMTTRSPVTINQQRLLQRFLRYVRVGTAANPNSTNYPSSPGQTELGRLLAAELAEITIQDAHLDEHSLVWGTVPATDGGSSPAVALVAHLDTSPEARGDGVNPQVIEAYPGGDITLPAGNQIKVATSRELVRH
jgi:tripeptide aminopeptidase